MRANHNGQATLFEADPRPTSLHEDEPPDACQRRRNRERQRVWRQRHAQFYVPLIESPTGDMFVVEALSTCG